MIVNVEVVTVRGADLTLDRIVARRWRAYLPGYVERVLGLNPYLAEQGPVLAIGTKIKLPAPDIQERQGAVRILKLWD